MNRILISLTLLLAVGCATTHDDAAPESDDSALRGSISVPRACAIRDAYRAAELRDLEPVAFESLPEPVRKLAASDALPQRPLEASVKLAVEGVGAVYVLEYRDNVDGEPAGGATLVFVTGTGVVSVVATVDEREPVTTTWQRVSGNVSVVTPLVCATP
jgi:hypothetical protein